MTWLKDDESANEVDVKLPLQVSNEVVNIKFQACTQEGGRGD